MAKVKLLHVPYRGSAPALQGLLAGDVDLIFDNLGVSLPLVEAGKLRLLAVASAQRLPSLPDVPTIAETLPGFEVTSWYSLVAPAATPPERIARIHDAIARAFARPDVREKIAALGAETVANTPAEFAALLKAESARWQTLAREANIRVD